MKAVGIFIIPFVLLFTSCKKEEGGAAPHSNLQISKIYDADISATGTHDNATFFYYYDLNGRVNLVKEYDTTLTPAFVVVKINYKKAQYAYDVFGNVTTESVTSYSPVVSNQTTKYFYDGIHRMKKKIVYNNSVYNDSTVYTYINDKIAAKHGINVVDTFYLNSVTKNLDSTYFGTGGSTYKYVLDNKINIFKTHDYAFTVYDINPYKCDHNIRKVKTPFGVYNYTYTYNANNYPTFYTTILGSGSGCNVTFYYQ